MLTGADQHRTDLLCEILVPKLPMGSRCPISSATGFGSAAQGEPGTKRSPLAAALLRSMSPDKAAAYGSVPGGLRWL